MHTFVLGGGGGPRDLGVPLTTDMEQIDPDAVELPSWYRPNPGRASDLAFIVFTGEGERTRMSRITNRRWALSAFGTASSAALSSRRHRLQRHAALPPVRADDEHRRRDRRRRAAGDGAHFDPATFWEEARRYGVTVASYTWTLLHDLVEAPPQPGERHHPVRLFIGSGMPRGLWRRVQERFKPARVLEFYASTEAGAILVNLSGAKPGSMGRPLPGSAEVRIAAYDIDAGAARARSRRLRAASAGSTRSGCCWRGSARATRPRTDAAARRVRARRRVAGHRRSVPPRRRRRLLARRQRRRCDPHRRRARSSPARSATRWATCRRSTWRSPTACRRTAADAPVAVAAVTLRRGRELSARDIGRARSRCCRVDERPAIVHVVDEIPVTTWFRPLTGPLREAGIPEPGEGVQAWYRRCVGGDATGR